MSSQVRQLELEDDDPISRLIAPFPAIAARAVTLCTPVDDMGVEEVVVTDEALRHLTPREEKVIKMRFGLGAAGREHTLEEVGLYFDVTRERVRQIEARALEKLRHPARARMLRPFLEGSASGFFGGHHTKQASNYTGR